MKAYNPQKRVVEILNDKNVQNAILDIFQSRLYNTGETGTGVRLRTDSAKLRGGISYSPNNKLKRNKRNVDLYITGSFYDSWRVEVGSQVTRIISTQSTEIYKNFTTSFSSGKDMLDKIGTPTAEELVRMQKIIMPYIEQDLKQILNVQV